MFYVVLTDGLTSTGYGLFGQKEGPGHFGKYHGHFDQLPPTLVFWIRINIFFFKNLKNNAFKSDFLRKWGNFKTDFTNRGYKFFLAI